mmetsp:Transcript_3684/g.5047  ORF Transcript_3684/g.5047 Transcript_3684/m.5047 type:complete len:270 (+) Transcript_3684:1454-2263(+)
MAMARCRGQSSMRWSLGASNRPLDWEWKHEVALRRVHRVRLHLLQEPTLCKLAMQRRMHWKSSPKKTISSPSPLRRHTKGFKRWTKTKVEWWIIRSSARCCKWTPRLFASGSSASMIMTRPARSMLESSSSLCRITLAREKKTSSSLPLWLSTRKAMELSRRQSCSRSSKPITWLLTMPKSPERPTLSWLRRTKMEMELLPSTSSSSSRRSFPIYCFQPIRQKDKRMVFMDISKHGFSVWQESQKANQVILFFVHWLSVFEIVCKMYFV